MFVGESLHSLAESQGRLRAGRRRDVIIPLLSTTFSSRHNHNASGRKCGVLVAESSLHPIICRFLLFHSQCSLMGKIDSDFTHPELTKCSSFFARKVSRGEIDTAQVFKSDGFLTVSKAWKKHELLCMKLSLIFIYNIAKWWFWEESMERSFAN